ncbi:MAG: hypothetical protein GF315_04065 [candidate division Zixibacteria bacterium]|nr:hypothetical protein [candidate division Zixibacteria bacterium]
MKTMRLIACTLSIISVLAAIILLSTACDRAIDSPDSPYTIGEPPPTPIDISISVGDGSLRLTWGIGNQSGISRYNIYRTDSVSMEFERIGSSANEVFTDTSLINGHRYYYKISSVSNQNYEGYPSDSLSGVPEVFGVVIENGNSVTNSISVTLRMIAPDSTRYMMISNDPSFADAIWENYSAERTWYLEPPDGERSIYVRYRDLDDNRTIDYFYDSIILDRSAAIDSVTEDTGGEAQSAGDTIRFMVYAGETYGFASVDIDTVVTDISLYDNGENGDSVAADGIYTVNYIVQPGIETEDALVIGRFTDKAGNSAPPMTAPGRITIGNP